jgi:hypothetical protein
VNLEALREAVERGLVHVTDHADEEANNDSLSLEEIYESLGSGRVIEDYPEDRPYPSCLVMGYCHQRKQERDAEPVHSVWAYNESSGFCVLVTVYRPDSARWSDDYEKRRRG